MIDAAMISEQTKDTGEGVTEITTLSVCLLFLSSTSE